MEEILDIYKKPYDPTVPLVCMDEKPYPAAWRIQGAAAYAPR